MEDLANSFFKFNSSSDYKGLKQQNKKQKSDDSEKKERDKSDEQDEVSGLEAEPQIISQKERKILTNWLDAGYTSAFQYNKINIKYVQNNIKIGKTPDVDINDPAVIYDYLKKYINILYDYNCSKEIEKVIIEELEKELKNYFTNQGAGALGNYLEKKFNELKNKYLIKNILCSSPVIVPKEAITTEKYSFIQELEQRYK